MEGNILFSYNRLKPRDKRFFVALNFLSNGLNVSFDSLREKPVIHKIKFGDEIIGVGKILFRPSMERLISLRVKNLNDYKIGFLKGIFVREGFRRSDGVFYFEDKSIAEKLIDTRIEDARRNDFDCLLTTARESSSKIYRGLDECVEVGTVVTENGRRNLFVWVNSRKHEVVSFVNKIF